jgi:hypothetical protein
VNEEDYRYTQVAYLSIKENVDTSDNDVDEAEETVSVDLEAKAAEVLEALKNQMEIYAVSGEDDDSIPYNAVIDLYSDETDITISYTASQQYAKPDSDDDTDDSTDTDADSDTDTDSTETTETLQSICWNNLSTGDYTTWYDADNSVAYVVYCTNDDVEDAKESAIETELDNRRSDRFEEKYAELVKNSSTFTVKSRVYSQVKYEDISYSSDEDVDASGNDVDASDND